MIRQVSAFFLLAFSYAAMAVSPLDPGQLKKFKDGCVDQVQHGSMHFAHPDKLCECIGKKFNSFIVGVSDATAAKEYSDYFLLNFTPNGLKNMSQEQIDEHYLMNESITDWERQCLPEGKGKKH